MKILAKSFFIALFLSGIFLMGYIVLASKGLILSVEPGLSIGGISRWCERISEGIFREPVNALSNLGFMVAGLTMLYVLTNDLNKNNNNFNSLNSISVLYAGAAIFLGPRVLERMHFTLIVGIPFFFMKEPFFANLHSIDHSLPVVG